MSFLKNVEKVLGYTFNDLSLKNCLQNDKHLYEKILQFKLNSSQNKLEENWSEITTFIPLLYAKSLNINTSLNWKQRNNLLEDQFKLSTVINLVVEANNLSLLEKYHKSLNNNSLSTQLYIKSLNLIKQFDEKSLYFELKKLIDDFHLGINEWNNLELNLYKLKLNNELSFDNYNDFLTNRIHPNFLLKYWENYIKIKYANFLAFSCSSMSILNQQVDDVIKKSYNFGYNFAFYFKIGQELENFLNGPDEERINLKLPVSYYFKLLNQNEKIDLIDIIKNENLNSLAAYRLKNKIKESETLKQIEIYSNNYLRLIKNNLIHVNESNSKEAINRIIDNLLSVKIE